jgi:L-galactose dehydrogenase
MRYRTIANTNIDVSVIGFGGATLGNEFNPMDYADAERLVHLAIDKGINFFDTSPYYGRTLSEERMGRALEGKRGQVVLSTKLGRYDKASFDFSAARVKSSIDESLGRLRTDHVDLLIAHDIEFSDREQIVDETVPAMRELVTAGKVQKIGISGLPLKILADVAVRARVDFVLSYCRYNPLAQDMDVLLTPVLEEHGIGLLNAAPVHLRLLTVEGPMPSHPASDAVKQAAKKVVALCLAHGIDPAVFALAFCLRHPYASSTLVGMSKASELEMNLATVEMELDPALIAEVARIVEPVKDRLWQSGKPENQDG